jgi:hypothetical protein
VEEGSHEDLYRNESSAYHALVQLQEQATDKRITSDARDLEVSDDEDVTIAAVSAEDSSRRSSAQGKGLTFAGRLSSGSQGMRPSGACMGDASQSGGEQKVGAVTEREGMFREAQELQRRVPDDREAGKLTQPMAVATRKGDEELVRPSRCLNFRSEILEV